MARHVNANVRWPHSQYCGIMMNENDRKKPNVGWEQRKRFSSWRRALKEYLIYGWESGQQRVQDSWIAVAQKNSCTRSFIIAYFSLSLSHLPVAGTIPPGKQRRSSCDTVVKFTSRPPIAQQQSTCIRKTRNVIGIELHIVSVPFCFLCSCLNERKHNLGILSYSSGWRAVPIHALYRPVFLTELY